MSTGGSFWDGSVFTPGFGVYSTSTSNQNKRNVGYNNSLNEGGNYSTTLGANFSTVVLGNFSTTAGVSMSSVVGANLPNTEGGKVELIIPWSVKWTRGLYDYDFKSCTTQVKTNLKGNVYTVNTGVNEFKGAPGNADTKIVDKVADFAKSADQWLGTKNLVAKDEIKKVLDGDMQYATLTTKVAGQCNTTAAAVTLKGAGQFTMSTMGKLSLEGAAGISMEALRVQINGAIVNLG